MTKVFLVDDHELMREGLKTVLNADSNLKVVGEAGSFKELTERMGKTGTDIVILDISLPDRNGLDVLKYLKDNYPGLQVLILSMHAEERFALRALKAGAAGYVNKQSAARELVKAIEKVLRGGKYLSPELTDQLIEEVDKKPKRAPHEILTNREFEVLRLIASGRSASQIARDLALSTNTIMTYRSRILEKMKMKTTADLVRYVVEKRLID